VNNFIDFARANGLEIDPAKLYAGERIRRCGTSDKPRSANGAYFWDGKRGWVFNWASEARVQWFNDRDAKPWTDDEKRAWQARRQAARNHQDAQQQQAAMRAAELIRSTKPGTHDYLARKGFPDREGMIDPDGALIVPMRNLETNALMGAQRIYWDEPKRLWVKKMLPGMRAKGAILRLGDKTASETFLVEGYSTALSVLAALRSVGLRASVMVCFSSGNLEFIAPQVKGQVFVFADNDESGVGEKSAQATGLPYCMSAVVGEDANDLHRRAGLMPVVQLLMDVRRGRSHV
jgi:putative DNA primase/helicase